MSDKQSILAVDDTPENLQVLKGILVLQYSILAAISGEAALKILSKTRPDLILLDIMMSGMDGYELCRILKSREDTADIPVIFVSAMSEVKDERQGFEVGAVDYITKPVNAELVRARVKTHLMLADQNRTFKLMVEERTYELEQTQRAAIKMLAEAGHYNDSDTGVHIWPRASYSSALAEAFGVDGREVCHAGIFCCYARYGKNRDTRFDLKGTKKAQRRRMGNHENPF